MISRKGEAPRPQAGARLRKQKYKTRHLTAGTGDYELSPRNRRGKRKQAKR